MNHIVPGPYFRSLEHRLVGEDWVFDAIDLDGQQWRGVVAVRGLDAVAWERVETERRT